MMEGIIIWDGACSFHTWLLEIDVFFDAVSQAYGSCVPLVGFHIAVKSESLQVSWLVLLWYVTSFHQGFVGLTSSLLLACLNSL